MKFALFIPVYNRDKTLGRAIESALTQGADEVVVIDDCSTDESLAVAAHYPVRIVRHAAKSPCHLRAVDEIMAATRADYYGGLGADDILYPGMVQAMREVAGTPGVIFCDYALLRDGDPPTETEVRRYGFDRPTVLDPEIARRRLTVAGARRPECGVGSALRADALAWLRSQDWTCLGPWSDSWGFTAAAARFGAAYIPGPLAGFVTEQAEASYHQRVIGDQNQVARYRQIGLEWQSRPEVAEAIRGIPLEM